MRDDNQNPSYTNVVLTKKTKSFGAKAVRLYSLTGQSLMTWQQRQIRAIMAIDNKGQWRHMNYCIGLSRRNGKGEVLAAREMFGLIVLKEKICHTAHRTTTSHDAFNRLYNLLIKAGYQEHSKKKKNMPERSFYASKQYGLEHIEISGGGVIDFRTRTNNGGLGEGFDLLIIDEAQEYTSKQESALLYTVSASKNLIVQRLGRMVTVTECYRQLANKTMEVRVTVAYNAKMALDAGKNVLCEKPAGVYTAQVQEMNEMAAKHPEVVFGMMFNQRTNPAFIKMRE